MGRFSRSKFVRLAPPAAAFVLALLVRALPAPTTFTAAGVFPNGPDAYYHLRRIAWSVVNFPRVLEFDAYVSFPDGGRPIWTPLFDFSFAALAHLALGPHAGPPLERLLMWAPPLLGALCVLAVHALARRAWGRRVAAFAALLLALLPAHFVYSQLGELDHHVAVALAVTLVLAAGLSLLRRAGGGARSLAAGACWLGAAQAFALLLWPGCLLAVATLDATLVACVVACPRREEAVSLARSLALAHAFAAAVVAAFARGNQWERWGSVSPVVLSWFQPVFLAAGALCFAALAAIFGRFQASLARRALVVLAVGLLALGVSFAALPGLSAGARDAWGWLAKREVFQASVAESGPLLAGLQGFETDTAVELFSRLFYAFPLLLVLLVAGGRSRGPEDARARGVLAAWSAVWLAAALLQRRFVNELSIAFALIVALCASDALGVARRTLAGRGRAATSAAVVAALAAALWLFAPIASFYAPYLANLRRARLGEPLVLSGWQPEQRGLTQLARWLAAHTPPTAGFWDASAQPEYGVLASWGDGHVLRYVAERPMVQDNFGDDVGERSFALAEAYFAAESEPAALAIAEQLRARYVIVRGAGSGHSPGYADASLLKRLHKLRGTEGRIGDGDGASDASVPALAQHRLIFDARIGSGPEEGSRPSYKIFEIVPGARITGRAQPGAEVRAELRINLALRGRMLYRSATRADAQGRYEIVVPYANDPPADAGAAEIRPGRSYRLRSAGREVELVVSDGEVRRGARVEAPSLAN